MENIVTPPPKNVNKKPTPKFDVIIVGAGPGGCLAARDLARRGFTVGLFDRDRRGAFRKTIVVEVEKTVFPQVGLELPSLANAPYQPASIRVFSSQGREAFLATEEPPTQPIYQDLLVKDILKQAEAKGAHFYGGHEALTPVIIGGRVKGVLFQSARGKKEVLAPLVIDASGFNAALVSRLDPRLEIEFPESRRHIVTAATGLYELDLRGWEATGTPLKQPDEEIWTRLGVYGPYSTVYYKYSQAQKRAYLLIGFKAEAKAPSLAETVNHEKAQLGYFGAFLHGGEGPIRIRHSLDKLVADGFMVIGEAACQVIPMHGSGVASALYAGHLAAHIASQALKKGDTSTAALWPYAATYQRGRGKILAVLDVSRLSVESLTREQVDALLESGLMASEDFHQALIPQLPEISWQSLPQRLKGILKHRSLIPALVKMGRLSWAVEKHYLRYPEKYDPEAFRTWQKKKKNLFAALGE